MAERLVALDLPGVTHVEDRERRVDLIRSVATRSVRGSILAQKLEAPWLPSDGRWHPSREGLRRLNLHVEDLVETRPVLVTHPAATGVAWDAWGQLDFSRAGWSHP